MKTAMTGWVSSAGTAAATGLVLACAVCATACGGGAQAKGGPEFPSRQSLEELARSRAAADPDGNRKTLSVDTWAPAAGDASASDATTLLKRAADVKGVRFAGDSALECTAREIGRFYATHDAFPDEQLQAYMGGVCGISHESFGASVWAIPTAELEAAGRRQEWENHVFKGLSGWLGGGLTHAAASELKEGDKSVFSVVTATSAVEWEQVGTQVDAEGAIDLSGTLRTPSAFVYGLVNAGAHGFRECASDPRIRLPKFRLKCSLDPNDASAWVSVHSLPPSRILARGVGHLLLRREGATLDWASAAPTGTAEPVAEPASFSRRLLSIVNEARVAAKLPALKLAERESQTSARLASHYFGAAGSEQIPDQIALGLMAGWDIAGTVRSSGFYSNTLSGSLDPRRWFSYMMQQPAARRVLLDPAARQIAIGPELNSKSKTIGALLNTYSFYDSKDHRADVERFVARLNQRRSALGLPPAQLANAPEMAAALRSVETDHDPNAALQSALQQVVARRQQSAEGVFIEASDLDHVTFPEVLLRRSVSLAISATHHRYPDSAWGTLTVLVVVLESTPPEKTATRARGSQG